MPQNTEGQARALPLERLGHLYHPQFHQEMPKKGDRASLARAAQGAPVGGRWYNHEKTSGYNYVRHGAVQK